MGGGEIEVEVDKKIVKKKRISNSISIKKILGYVTHVRKKYDIKVKMDASISFEVIKPELCV